MKQRRLILRRSRYKRPNSRSGSNHFGQIGNSESRQRFKTKITGGEVSIINKEWFFTVEREMAKLAKIHVFQSRVDDVVV